MEELDYMRGFAIIAIVLIHMMGFAELIDHPNLITPVADYLTHLGDCGVPIFLMISGFVLGLHHFDVLDRRRFYTRRLKTVLFPYLFFALIYAVFNWFFLGERSIVQQVVTFALFNGTRALWFVAVIIQLYLLFPYLVKAYKRLGEVDKEYLFLLVPLVIYLLWYGILRDAFINALGGYLGFSYYNADLTARLLCVPYLLFFAVGIHISRHRSEYEQAMKQTVQWQVVALALFLALVLQLLGLGFLWAVVLLPFVALTGSALYRLSLWLKARDGESAKVMRTIGLYSYGIYLVHMLAMSVVTKPLYMIGLGVGDAVFYVLLLPGTIAVSVAVIYALGRLPHGQYLSGIKTTPKRGLVAAPGYGSRGANH